MYLLFQACSFSAAVAGRVNDLLGWFRAAALDPLLSGLPQAAQACCWMASTTRNHGRRVRAHHRAVLSVHGGRRGHGYLSRAAFPDGRADVALGLDGRGFVMLLMGFGCTCPR